MFKTTADALTTLKEQVMRQDKWNWTINSNEIWDQIASCIKQTNSYQGVQGEKTQPNLVPRFIGFKRLLRKKSENDKNQGV